MRRSFVVLLVVLPALAACVTRRVDLGGAQEETPVAATPQAAPPPVSASQYGCADWADEEMYALREGACPGRCSEPGALPYALGSKKETLAATAGSWLACSPGFGPPDAVGVEFAPGCRLFFLRYDEAGSLVRGTTAAFQARYDIFDPRGEGQPRRIDMHLDERTTVTYDVEVMRCPEHLRLVTARGASFELAREGAAASINPTR